MKGLKLYEELLKEDELSKLIDFVAELREAGQNGKLSGDFFLRETPLIKTFKSFPLLTHDNNEYR